MGVKLADRLSGPELSDRELEVLRPIVAGKSNHHISKVLHISESTVKFHLNNILSKRGVSDRTQPAIPHKNAGLSACSLIISIFLINLTIMTANNHK